MHGCIVMNSDELNKLYGKVAIEINGYIHTGDIDNLKKMDLLCDSILVNIH